MFFKVLFLSLLFFQLAFADSKNVSIKQSLQNDILTLVELNVLPKNSQITSVFTQNDEIVIDISLDKTFIKNHFTEELLEQLSRKIDLKLAKLAPEYKKIHLVTELKGKKIALSNLLKIPQTPIKEPEHEKSLTPFHTQLKAADGALSGKVLFISQAHGWIDYSGNDAWETQRPIYQDIVEDFVNAEAINQYLLEYLDNAGAKVFTMRERDMNTNMVIVDNADTSAFVANGVYEEQGDNALFSNSTDNGFANFQAPYNYGVDPFRDNSGSDRVISTAATETARAVWKPVIPEDGYYHVYVSYSGHFGDDRTTTAKYVVSHGGIETEVIVNQKKHRFVWNDIGKFYFKAGNTDFVALSNQSNEVGTTVSADAVKFGGGMGDVKGVNHAIVSAYPRWEEGARSWVQFQGASSSVYASGDVGARSKFAAWEHYAGEDSVYVSWHSNGASGSARGTSSYIYSSNPPNGSYDATQAVAGSAELQAAIQNEIINDIHQAWDANWQNRGLRSAYFGEINPANNNEMPSMLIEMAFHDNVDDANALRNPQFRKLVARSVYQGIVKYFANRDGLSVNLLPEPPTHLKVISTQSGKLNVSWHAPLTDANGVYGDVATSYMVYKSTDGYNFDNGVETTDLFYQYNGLVDGDVYYIQIRAKNAGGLSLASETLGTRVTYTNEDRVLIVNGFDRLTSGQLVYMNMPDLNGFVDRMFLDQMNTFNYIIQHGDAINESGVGFDSIANEMIEDGLFSIDVNDYTAVVWILGEESSAGSTLVAAEQSQLQTFLNAGGKLFISGAEIAWDLDNLGSAADKNFYNNILMTQYTADDANVYQANGQATSPYLSLSNINFDDGSHGTYQVEFPDVISPTNTATTCMQYVGAQSACTYVDTGTYQVIHLGFPFETIYPKSMRNDVMAETLNYFSIPFYNAPPIAFADSFNVAEDSINNIFDVLINDTDNDGGLMEITAIGTPANGSSSFNTTQVVYTPAANYCGSDNFDYTLNGGSSATVNITINCVNDQPSFELNTEIYVNINQGGQALEQLVACSFDFGNSVENTTQNVADFLVTIQSDGNSVIQSVDVDTSGVLNYQITGNSGAASIDVSLKDNGGTDFGGENTSASKTINIHVHDYIFVDGFHQPTCF